MLTADTWSRLLANGRWLWWSAVAALLVILAVELFVPAAKQAQTPDEANHMLAGVRSWRYGDFGTNPEHPPLAKLVAALPVLRVPAPPAAPYTMFFKFENYSSGIAFLYTHDADAMLFRARVAISIFTFALALLVLAAGCEMFGPTTGLTALLIFVFEPNLLAHGAMVTTDMAETCCFFASIYSFYRWRKLPTTPRLLIFGIATGLALASKHSGVFLLPVLFVLTIMDVMSRANAGNRRNRLRQAARLLLSLILAGAVAYGVLWAFYGFRYQARPQAMAMVPTLAEYTLSPHSPLLEAVIPRLAAWHLLPEAYLYGLVDIAVAEHRDPMFLLGTEYTTGKWFYFPMAFVIKTTVGFLMLLALSPFLKRLRQDGKGRVMMYLLVPPLLYFAASLTSTMNIGIRHILPVFPFVVVIAAAAAVSLAEIQFRGRRWGLYVAGALVLFHVVSSALVFPWYLTYANEAWGGPTNTYRLLTDSNADWNQGLRAAKSYLALHNIQDCWFAHYGWDVDPAYYQIPCKPLPDGITHYFGQPLPSVPARIDGTLLISATEADGDYWGPGDLNPYAQFLHRRPDALIANSILVFNGSFDVSAVSALAHLSRGQQLAKQQQWAQAVDEVHAAMDLAPHSAEAYAVMGQIQIDMHHQAEAAQSFHQALTLAQADHAEFQLSRILKLPPQFVQP